MSLATFHWVYSSYLQWQSKYCSWRLLVISSQNFPCGLKSSRTYSLQHISNLLLRLSCAWSQWLLTKSFFSALYIKVLWMKTVIFFDFKQNRMTSSEEMFKVNDKDTKKKIYRNLTEIYFEVLYYIYFFSLHPVGYTSITFCRVSRYILILAKKRLPIFADWSL